MGDNRDAGRAPGAAPASKKKGPAPDAGGGGGVPDGAVAQGGSLTKVAQSFAPRLIGIMQSAGGNAEVTAELESLTKSVQSASEAKGKKDQAKNAGPGQAPEGGGKKKKEEEKKKAEGGGGGGGGGAAKGGAPGGGGGGGDAPKGGDAGAGPPQKSDPKLVEAFHKQRAAALLALATQHGTISSQLTSAAGQKGIAPDLVGFLGEGAQQSTSQQAALKQLAQVYQSIGAALGGTSFIGEALPGKQVPALYQKRADTLQSLVKTVEEMIAEYNNALQTEQKKVADCDAQLASLKKQEGAGGGGSGKDKGSAPKATEDTKLAGATKGAGGGGSSGAESKSKGPAGTSEDKSAAPDVGKQMDAANAKKKGITEAINATAAVVATMKAYAGAVATLVQGYSSLPPAPSGGGGGGGGGAAPGGGGGAKGP